MLKGSLDSNTSPSVKIQTMGGKVCLMCKGKTLLGIVKKLFVFTSLLTTPNNVFPLHHKQTSLPIIWIFTEGEGDGIESRVPFKIFSTSAHCRTCIQWICSSVQMLRRRDDIESLGTYQSPKMRHVSAYWLFDAFFLRSDVGINKKCISQVL